MKKTKIISMLLSLVLLVQCFPLNVGAQAPETTPSEETRPTLPIAQDSMSGTTDMAFGSVSIMNGCRTLDGMVPLAGSDRKAESAQSIVIYERSTNTMIYSYNPDMKLAPGGLSKLLTALLVIEHCPNLDDVVRVEPGIASRVPGGAITIKLKSEEELTVNDLLHCMILQSANDAAIALAEHVAGTQSSFVDMMNKRLNELGCGNTVLSDVHGLGKASQYTTARDLARMVQECTKNETFCKLFRAEKYTVSATNMSEVREFESQNYLVDTANIQKFQNQYVTGGFASYNAADGASIVCTASTTTEKKQGLELVCVLLGATRTFYENGWQVETYGNFEEILKLLYWCYSNFKVNRVIYEGQGLKQFPVSGGESDVVGSPTVNIDSVLPVDARMDNLIKKYSVVNGGLSAPIKKGDKVSTVEVWYQSSCLMEAELFALSGVKTVAEGNLNIKNGMTSSDHGIKGGTIGLIILAVVLVPLGIYLGINSYRRSQARARYRRRMDARRRSRNL